MPADGRIKLTYVIGTLGVGGAERQLLELLRRLDPSRFDPSLVLFDDATADQARGLVSRVFSLAIPATNNARTTWRRAALFVGAFAKLTRHLLQRRPHIVHAFLPAACVLAGPAAKLAGVPAAIGSRRGLPAQYRSSDSLPRRIEQLSMRFMDRMLGNSKAVTQTIVTDDGFPADRARTIYNGVDTQRFHPGRQRHWRANTGWSDDHVVFGTVANFFAYKRHIDVVRAAARVRRQYPNARFVLVGEDRGSLEDVRREASSLGVNDIVHAVPGTRAPEDVFAAIDVCICPSASEGCSNVVLEAMSSGRPVIATDTGGNAELVRDGYNGMVVPIGNPEALAHAIAHLMSLPGFIEQAGRRSRELAEDRFSTKCMVRSYEQLYSELLAERC